MYDIILAIIDHELSSGYSIESTVINICGVCIIMFTVVFIDLVKNLISGFIRR